jgi:hypothetical protein
MKRIPDEMPAYRLYDRLTYYLIARAAAWLQYELELVATIHQPPGTFFDFDSQERWLPHSSPF